MSRSKFAKWPQLPGGGDINSLQQDVENGDRYGSDQEVWRADTVDNDGRQGGKRHAQQSLPVTGDFLQAFHTILIIFHQCHCCHHHFCHYHFIIVIFNLFLSL